MKTQNNLKEIREIYGATQEQIANALSVNRVTVANWEKGASVVSAANREKLSIYYGIGPDYFYDKPLDETAKELIIKTAEKERRVVAQSVGERNKHEEFRKAIDSLTFSQAMQHYMLSFKFLLAKVEDADLDMLHTALELNEKLRRRLSSAIELREEEARNGSPTLSDLMKEISNP